MKRFSKASMILLGIVLMGGGCTSGSAPGGEAEQDFSHLNNTDIICCQFSDIASGTSTEQACAEYGGEVIECE